MVIEVKLAVTGVAGYDYDPRRYRSIPKAGSMSKPINKAASVEAGHNQKPMVQQHHQGQVLDLQV